jgi:hypothetical protein
VNRSEKVRLIVRMVVVGTAVSVAYHLVVGLLTGTYPFATFTGDLSHIWGDWSADRTLAGASISGGLTRPAIVYTPLAAVGYAPWTVIPAWWGAAIQCALFVYVVVRWTATFVWQSTGPRWSAVMRVAAVALLAYPVVFAVARGNLEMTVFALLAVFAYLYYVRSSRWAMVFLGAAAALKLAPALLILVPLADRRWRDAALAVMTAVLLTAGSIAVLCAVLGQSPIGVLRLWMGTLAGHAAYPAQLETLGQSHSLWTMFAPLAHYKGVGYTALRSYVPLYIAGACSLAAAVAGYACLVEKTPWKRLAVLVAAMLLLPVMSHDYRLVHILLPLGVFVAAPPSRSDLYFGALMSALLIPLDYTLVYKGISVSNIVYPAILLLIIGRVVVDGLGERLSDRRAAVGMEDCTERIGAQESY